MVVAADASGRAARLGVQGVEVNTGGWSTAPHFDIAAMQADAGKRRAFLKAFADRGLEVIALNANGNPLHPTDAKQGQCLRDTIRLAGEMGIRKVCTMSGLPEGRAGDVGGAGEISGAAASSHAQIPGGLRPAGDLTVAGPFPSALLGKCANCVRCKFILAYVCYRGQFHRCQVTLGVTGRAESRPVDQNKRRR